MRNGREIGPTIAIVAALNPNFLNFPRRLADLQSTFQGERVPVTQAKKQAMGQQQVGDVG